MKKNFVWIYATIQFGFVVLFAHIFYSVVRFDVMSQRNLTLLKLWFLIESSHSLPLTCVQVKQPVMCIVLATMIGFGLTMTGTTAINEYLKWRRSNAHQPAEPGST